MAKEDRHTGTAGYWHFEDSAAHIQDRSYVHVTLFGTEGHATCALSVHVRDREGDWVVPDGWDKRFTFNGSHSLLWSDTPASLYMQIARFLELVLLRDGKLAPAYQGVLMMMSGDDFADTAEGYTGDDTRPFTDAQMEAKIYG